MQEASALPTIVTRQLIVRFLAWALLVLCAVSNPLTAWLAITAARGKEKVIILGGSGDVLYCDTQKWDSADELFFYCNRSFLYALYKATGAGPGNPDLLDKVITSSLRESVAAETKLMVQNLATRSARQDVEIISAEIIFRGKLENFDSVKIRSTGQIVQYGILPNGVAFVDPFDFTITLTLVRNSAIADNRKLPLLVAAKEVAITPANSKP